MAFLVSIIHFDYIKACILKDRQIYFGNKNEWQ